MTASTSRLVIEISSEQAKRNAELLNRELQSIEQKGTFATKSMDSMSVATRSLAAQMLALVSAGALVSKMDAYTNLQNRLKLVTSSQTELNKAMSDTFAIAQKTRQSWDAAAQVYQGFANNAKTLGLTMSETARLTETVSKAVAISGASSASAEAALIQFNQALGSSVLRGEELNSIMEQTPALARAIAEGMGITIGQLRTVAATGAITSEALVKALEKASVSVDELFAKTDPTIGQSFTLLSNEATKFVGEAGKASGAATLTAETIKTLAENLDLLANSAAVIGIGLLTKAILTKTAALKESVITSIQSRSALIAENQANVEALGVESLRAKQLAALAATEVNLARIEYNTATSATARAAAVQRLTAAEIAHSIAMKEATVATTAYTVAQTRLNAVATLSSRALSLVGGPIGALTLGVSALAAGYIYLTGEADNATNSLDIQKQTVKELADEYSKLSMAKLIEEIDSIEKRAADAQSQASKAVSALSNMTMGNSDYSVKRHILMLEQLRKIKDEGLDTATALQNLSKSKLFTDGEIRDAQRYFAQLDEGTNAAREYGYQKALVNSYMSKSSGLYEENANKISKLSNEQERLSNLYSSSREHVQKAAESFLQIGDNSGVASEKLGLAQKALEKYNRGTINATQLSQIFQKNLPIPQETIESFIAQSRQSDAYKLAMTNVNTELKKQNDLRDNYQKQHAGVLDSINAETEGTDKQALAQKKLNEELKKRANKSMMDDNYWINTYNASTKSLGGDKKGAASFADFALDWRKDNKIDRSATLSSEQFKILNDLWLLDQKRKNLQDEATQSEKERTSELKKQQQVLEVNAKVLAASQKYNFSGLESKYNLPNGLLSAVMMQESHGNANDYNKTTGATGAFQFIHSTGKQYGVTGNERYDVGKSAEAASKFLAHLMEKFNGNIEKVIRAYHAGEKNVKQGTKLGPINNQYAKNVSAYMAGLNGFSGESKDFQDYLTLQIKSNEEINKMRDELASTDVQRLNAHNKKIADITKNFTGQERDTYIMQENQRYDAAEALAKAQFEMQVDGWQWVGEKRIAEQAKIDKLAIQASTGYRGIEKQIKEDSIDEQAKYEIEAYRRTQELKLLEFKAMLDAQVGEAQKAAIESQAQLNLSPNQLSQWQMQNQYSSNMSGAWDSWQNTQKDINQTDENGQYLKDAQIRHQMLLQAEQAYQDKLKAIREKGAADDVLIAKSQQDEQLQLWGNILSTSQNTFSQLAQSAKDVGGEQSSTYRTMFAMQKAFTIASSTLAAYNAYTTAFADPSAMTLTQKFAGGAEVMAALMPVISTIASLSMEGFATGGHVRGYGTETSDSIPAMLSDNEYVIKAKSVRSLGIDTLDYINRMGELPVKRASGGSVGDTSSYIVDRYNTEQNSNSNTGINIDIKINQDGSSSVDTQSSEKQKAAANTLANGLRKIISQECRQGGIIYNYVKGQ